MRRNPFRKTRGLAFFVVLVTLVEGAGLYAALYLADAGHEVRAIFALVAGELLETTVVAVALRPLTHAPIPVGDPFGALRRRRRFEGAFLLALVAELGIWVLWWFIAVDRDEPVIAASVLLVLMHAKHQLETSTVRDRPYFRGFWRETVASAAEVAGAVACLALIEDDRLVAGAGALAAGFIVEHTLLLRRLRDEIAQRNIALPRSRRPPDPLALRVAAYWARRVPRLWRALQSVGFFDRRLNRAAVNGLVDVMPARPNAFSTMAAYTSWPSLTDRTYTGRHLGPSLAGAPGRPSLDELAALFLRDGKMVHCRRSTVLFASFAQWFVDGFLRTRRDAKTGTRDILRSESNHDVDLAQLYGFDAAVTDALRAHEGGRLRSQPLEDEEYPEYLCDLGERKGRFDALPPPLGFTEMQVHERDRLFAMGSDPVSLGFTAFNVLFLREHNRIACELEKLNPGWHDERLFQTARNILTVMLLRIVVVEYINHIAGYNFRFRFPGPDAFRRSPWFRQNWMAAEFDLLYRWHSLMPDALVVGSREVALEDSLGRTDVLVEQGLRQFMLSATEQQAGRIGLFNTHHSLVPGAERASAQQGRRAELRSYNDYRELCRLPRVRDFSELSPERHVGRRLHDLYGSVDEIEFVPGLFAEGHRPGEILPPLMATMVSCDAFSQVITNPLLAPQVHHHETFTEFGIGLIDDTSSLAPLIARNVRGVQRHDRFSMTSRAAAER